LRQPNHIILDFNNNIKNNSSQYWALNFLEKNEKSPLFLNDLDLYKKFSLNSQFNSSNKFFTSNYGVNFSNYNRENEIDLTNIFNSKNVSLGKDDYVLKYSKNKAKNNFLLTSLSDEKLYKYNLERTFYLNKTHQLYSNLSTLNNSWYNTININFLRKERLYTKLKYSRSPAYDIVSGGAAAILAGLLGFLASEKFGIELTDSGDFYYLFMYVVFLCFSIRPLLMVADFKKSFFSLFSLNRIFSFYINIILSFLNYIKLFFK